MFEPHFGIDRKWKRRFLSVRSSSPALLSDRSIARHLLDLGVMDSKEDLFRSTNYAAGRFDPEHSGYKPHNVVLTTDPTTIYEYCMGVSPI